MPIFHSFTCPNCDFEFVYDENWKDGKCPNCASKYLVRFDCNDPHDAVLIPDFEPFKSENMSEKIQEIERKWLLKDLPKLEYNRRVDILQFYTEENFRYRREVDLNNGDITYYKIRKTSVGHGVNEEEIFDCDMYEFLAKMPHAKRSIHKTRHIWEKGGLKFEVDKMHSPVMVMLEVELQDIELQFDMPQEIQDVMILEVTGMKAFSNYNLCIDKNVRTNFYTH